MSWNTKHTANRRTAAPSSEPQSRTITRTIKSATSSHPTPGNTKSGAQSQTQAQHGVEGATAGAASGWARSAGGRTRPQTVGAAAERRCREGERAGQVGTLGCARLAAHNGSSVCCVAGGAEPKIHGVGRGRCDWRVARPKTEEEKGASGVGRAEPLKRAYVRASKGEQPDGHDRATIGRSRRGERVGHLSPRWTGPDVGRRRQ